MAGEAVQEDLSEKVITRTALFTVRLVGEDGPHKGWLEIEHNRSGSKLTVSENKQGQAIVYSLNSEMVIRVPHHDPEIHLIRK